jgi:HSP20 family protein
MTYVKFNRKPFEDTFGNFVDDMLSEIPVLIDKGFNNTIRKDSIPVNVKETDKGFILEVIAPGFEKTDFKVNMEQEVLTVSAEAKEESPAENEKQVRKEYSYRSFKRSFTIDDKIDATNIDASYVNGVLVLNLPTKEAVKQSATEIVIK